MRFVTLTCVRLAAGLVLFFATATACWAATSLEVLTLGSPGKEFEGWGTSLSVNEAHTLTFRWSTSNAGATGADWEVTTTNAMNAVVSVKTGSLASAPATSKLALFEATFLPAPVPSAGQKYLVRITAHDAQGNPLGAASAPVTITYEPAGPGVKFGADLGATPAPYVEPGHPQIRFIRYDPLTETTTGKLVLEVFNSGAMQTSPVQIRIADLHLIVRESGAPIPVGALKPNQHVFVTFTLDKQLTVGEPSVEANYAKWRARYSTGLRILAGTNKVGSLYVQWHQPAIAGRASSIVCGVAPPLPADAVAKVRACVEDRMRAILAASGGTQGFLFKRVGGAVLAAQHADTVFEPASSIKIIINFAASKRMQSDANVKLSTPVKWFQDFEKKSDGTNSSCPADTNMGTEQLKTTLSGMMMQSDNRRTQALRMFFGQDQINATAHGIGMVNTLYQHRDGCGGDAKDHPNQLTLTDVSKLYAGVADGSLLSGQRRTDFYAVMNGGAGTGPVALVAQEAPDGMPAAKLQSFIDQMADHSKFGSYTLDSGEYRTGAGSLTIPFRVGGKVVLRDFVYGAFVVKATNGNAAAAAYTVTAEIAREQIHDALLSW